MTISDNYEPAISVCDGITTVFTASWKMISTEYIKVSLQEIANPANVVVQTVGVDYTVDNLGGVSVTYITAPSNIYNNIIERIIPIDQAVSYSTSSGFDGVVNENSFDKLTAIAQHQQDILDRALLTPIGSSGTGLPAAEPSKILSWDSSGNLVNADAVVSSSVIATSTTENREIADRFSDVINVKDYGAEGDGATDDIAAIRAAHIAAGEGGVVYYPSGDYLVSDRYFVQAERVGSGNIIHNSVSYPIATALSHNNQSVTNVVSSSNISTDDYSHFPVVCTGRNNSIGALYYHGLNHGQSDKEGVCLPQAVASADALTIDGNYSSSGSVVLGAGAGDGTGATRIGVTSDANDSSVTFTVTGTYAGAAKVATVTGVNSNTVYTTILDIFDTITSVTSDAGCSGNISVGLWAAPSNVGFRRSIDGGKSFTDEIAVGDGLTAEDKIHYFPCMGVTVEGYYVIIYIDVDVEGSSNGTSSYRLLRRISYDGIFFSDAEEVTYTGAAPASTLFLYADIKVKNNGVMYLTGTSQDKTWLFQSSDNCKTFTATLIIDSGTYPTPPTYSEMDAQFINNEECLFVTRVNGVTSSMLQLKTSDNGATITNQGGLNIEITGGYVSPSLDMTYIHGEAYFILTYQLRDSSTVVDDEDSIIQHYVKADDAFNASTNWSDKHVLVSGIAQNNSGYPSVDINQVTNQCIIAYGNEADAKNSDVLFLSDNIVERALNKYSGSWTPEIIGLTTAGSNTYSLQNGSFTRDGDIVDLSFDVRLSTLASTGILVLGGFPFLFASNDELSFVQAISTNIGTNSGVYIKTAYNNNYLTIQHNTVDGASNLLDSEATGTIQLRGSIRAKIL